MRVEHERRSGSASLQATCGKSVYYLCHKMSNVSGRQQHSAAHFRQSNLHWIAPSASLSSKHMLLSCCLFLLPYVAMTLANAHQLQTCSSSRRVLIEATAVLVYQAEPMLCDDPSGHSNPCAAMTAAHNQCVECFAGSTKSAALVPADAAAVAATHDLQPSFQFRHP